MSAACLHPGDPVRAANAWLRTHDESEPNCSCCGHDDDPEPDVAAWAAFYGVDVDRFVQRKHGELTPANDAKAAIWADDVHALDAIIAQCQCCCGEHTRRDCPARAWNACRGQP